MVEIESRLKLQRRSAGKIAPTYSFLVRSLNLFGRFADHTAESVRSNILKLVGSLAVPVASFRHRGIKPAGVAEHDRLDS